MAKLSLQEQMLKAGLVNNKKLEKAKKSSKKSRIQAREAKEAVAANKQAQQAKDKELSLQQKQVAQQKELQAQIKQLIQMNQISVEDGDINYNFTDGTTVKNIEVTSQIQKQLTNGRLAIARDLLKAEALNTEALKTDALIAETVYVIIPASVADKIATRLNNDELVEKYIVVNNIVSQGEQEKEDPYADFAVPDDLMW